MLNQKEKRPEKKKKLQPKKKPKTKTTHPVNFRNVYTIGNAGYMAGERGHSSWKERVSANHPKRTTRKRQLEEVGMGTPVRKNEIFCGRQELERGGQERSVAPET